MFRAVLVALLISTPAMAVDRLKVECTLNADKSSVLVIAANPGEQSFQCIATCRANMSGQRAFAPVECRFNLSAKAGERTVCSKDGGAPDFYTAVGPTKYTCAPR